MEWKFILKEYIPKFPEDTFSNATSYLNIFVIVKFVVDD